MCFHPIKKYMHISLLCFNTQILSNKNHSTLRAEQAIKRCVSNYKNRKRTQDKRLYSTLNSVNDMIVHNNNSKNNNNYNKNKILNRDNKITDDHDKNNNYVTRDEIEKLKHEIKILHKKIDHERVRITDNLYYHLVLTIYIYICHNNSNLY